MEKTELTTTPAPAPALAAPAPVPAKSTQMNPFERSRDVSLAHGAVAIESERAIAEAQGKIVIAKRFPRNEYLAFEKAMDACKQPALARAAFYSFKRGGETVAGETIRLAEELARCWGNIEYGMRELSNRDGATEMEAFAWDVETGAKSVQQFTVRWIRDTRDGPKPLTDQRDIYEIAANMGARRLRERILSVLPVSLKERAVQQCRQTLAGDATESMAERIQRVVATFGKLGVTTKLLEDHLGHTLDKCVPEELADLHGIYTAIKDGQAKVSDWFGAKLAEPGVKTEDKKAERKPAKKTDDKAGDKKPEQPPATEPAAAASSAAPSSPPSSAASAAGATGAPSAADLKAADADGKTVDLF
jgi:hypothetical protein